MGKGGEMKGAREKEVSCYQDHFEGLQEAREKGFGPYPWQLPGINLSHPHVA